MLQRTPDDRVTQCTPFDESLLQKGMAQCLPRSQLKRSRASTNPTKEPAEDEHYVTIYLSGDGPPKIRSSISLKPYKDHIIGSALTRFLDCIGEAKKDSTSPAAAQEGSATPSITASQPEAPCISYPFARCAKRRRSDSSVTLTALDLGDNVSEDSSDSPSRPSEKLISLNIGDRGQCREFFLLGFQAIQQIDCRFLAKRWIKKIEPKKQVHHPYNGGKKDPKDPEATKPRWWPSGMTHKEPDHINKKDRIRLLTHLIMHTGTDLLISVDTGSSPMVKDLEEVTKPYLGELKNPKSWSILQDMFTTRRYMELVEFEGNDPDMFHKMVVDRSSDTRRAQGEPEHAINDDDLAECLEIRGSDAEDDECADLKPELTPNSSTVSSPVVEGHLSKDPVMHSMDYQDHLTNDTAPPARLTLKPNYSGQLPLTYGSIVSHHATLQCIPSYEASSMYAHIQRPEHQLHQRTNGPVPGLRRRADFSNPTLHTAQPASMSHWPATGPPDFCFPTQYQGMPSQAPTTQSMTSESPVLDDGSYRVHEQDQTRIIHYNMPIFNHHPPPPAFSETYNIVNPRWSHLACRPASSNQIPLSQLDDTPVSVTSELYQERLRELSDFD